MKSALRILGGGLTFGESQPSFSLCSHTDTQVLYKCFFNELSARM